MEGQDKIGGEEVLLHSWCLILDLNSFDYLIDTRVLEYENRLNEAEDQHIKAVKASEKILAETTARLKKDKV